eukprot:10750491-Alexandrium_andersonii.AAC.1
MSASLVGSEMCIRDRLLGVSGSPRCPVAASAAVGAVISRRMAAGGGRPVSYTHLTLPTICSV